VVTDERKRHRLLSCGRQLVILAGMEIMDDGGSLLSAHEVGEIVLRGPTAMQSYLNDLQATQEIKQYEWHHTGDIGYRDEDGYFYITDRKRDMIISGGFNIFPFEIERILLEHPAVQDCAVIGVSDEKWGEAVKAIVQLAPGAEVSQDELLTLCRNRLGDQRVVRHIRQWLQAGVLAEGPWRQQAEGTPQGGGHVHSWRTFPCTMSLPSGPPRGAAGMHGETSSACGTVTIAWSASRTKTPPSSCSATCGSAVTGSTLNGPLRRRASWSVGLGQANGARGVAKGNRRPAPSSA